MSDEDKNMPQSGQAESQSQSQNQSQPEPQQPSLSQLLQGRDKSIEADVIESDRPRHFTPGINETRFEEGHN